MLESWLIFVVHFFVQLLLFIIHAYYEKKLSEVPRILLWGVINGVPLGLVFDLVFGKFLGICWYTLGFGMPFLIINGALLYGLFAANVLLMQRVRLLHFCTWTLIVAAVFEITNLFFHLWTYAFVVPSTEFFIIVSAGNIGAAVLVALVWHVFFRRRFLFLDNLLKK